MKQRKRWLGLAFAPFALALLAFAPSAQANDFSGTCAQYPGTYDGTGNVSINNTGACTLPAVDAAGTVSITSSGTVTALSGVTGALVSINATGGAINASSITASNGQLSLTTASGAITADMVTASGNLIVDSGAGITFTNTAQSTNGLVDLKSKTALQTKKVTAAFGLKVVNTVSGNIVVDGGAATNEALKASNGPFEVVSKGSLTITGTSTSPNNELQLEANNNLKADAVSAGANLRIESKNGLINVTSTVDSNTADVSGGNMLIAAKNNVRTGALRVVGQTTGGTIQIDSNKGGGSVLFTIGATNTSNGVNGSIDVSGTTGGGADVLFGRRAVFITNGTSASTGGIRLVNAASLKLLNTSSRAGIVWLNGQKGPMTMPGGIAIDANGATGQFAGQIFLLAQTINFGNNATVRAVQGKTVSGNAHGVVLAAETINFQGANGLKILADGSGYDVFNPAYAYVIPQGSITSTSNNDFRFLNWTLPSIAAVETTDKPISLIGTGTAPLSISANGSDTAVAVRGNGTNINTAGAITLTAKGKSNHTIRIRDTAPAGDAKGLTLGVAATPSITLDASADNTVPGAGDAAGGEVRVTSDSFTLNAVAYSLTTNGPPTGNGNAGVIFFSTANSTIGATTKMTFSAVGPTVGTGNGGNITVFPGNVAGGIFKLGTSTGNSKVIADAGASGGDGGTINVNPFPGSISIETADAVTAKASSGATADSKGGSVTLIGNPNVTVSPSLTGASINVDGKGNRDGGSIKILGFGTLNLGSSAGGLNLSARAAGTGNGGNIEIGYASILTQDGTLSVSATSGNGSNGKGGIINFHDLGRITVAGTIRADSAGTGTGKAGSITLAQTAFNPMTLDGATISASGGCESNGVCGIVNITSPARISAVSTTIHADGTSGAKGGQVNLIGDSDQIVLDGSLITASGSQSGADGGFVNINNNAASISLVDTKFNANGFVSGAGGQVRITSGPTQPLVINSSGFLIQAKGGDTGAGGIVVIPSIQQLGGGSLFLVNTFIQAGSGANVTSSSTFGGSVSLNGATCQKTHTTFTYPKFYWNCVNPGSPSVQDAVPAQAVANIAPGVQSLNANTNLYVMVDAAQFSKFFTPSVAPDVAGFTLSENDNPHLIDAAVFENTTFSTGYAALSTDQLIEVTNHEFGHATDSAANYISTGAGFLTAAAADRAFLDAAGAPCLANGTGPLNGVIDNITHQQFCSNGGSGGTLNNPGGIYNGKSNSQIVAISSYILAQNTELYAQVFAYHSFVRNQAVQTGFEFTATSNGLFQKGYFQCAQAFGASLAGVPYTPQYACN